MEKVMLKCKVAVSGNVRAELMWCNEPMSFWGTVDPRAATSGITAIPSISRI